MTKQLLILHSHQYTLDNAKESKKCLENRPKLRMSWLNEGVLSLGSASRGLCYEAGCLDQGSCCALRIFGGYSASIDRHLCTCSLLRLPSKLMISV